MSKDQAGALAGGGPLGAVFYEAGALVVLSASENVPGNTPTTQAKMSRSAKNRYAVWRLPGLHDLGEMRCCIHSEHGRCDVAVKRQLRDGVKLKAAHLPAGFAPKRQGRFYFQLELFDGQHHSAASAQSAVNLDRTIWPA